MATDTGVIQGYCGVAAVDETHQIIVDAQAHGTGSEQALLVPVIEATALLRTETTVCTADAGYHSEANLEELAEQAIDAFIPDNGSNCVFNGYLAIKFQGAQQDCVPCALRSQCLRTPDKTKTRQVAFFLGRAPGHEKHADRMKTKIDSDLGKQMIARRFATVEPVFGNLRHNKRLDRFTLRGRRKVDGQWKLYCLTHNIEKLAHHGYAS
jgi:hypothetical protein